MGSGVHGLGKSSSCRTKGSLPKVSTMLDRIILKQRLMESSGYQSTTSNCVVLGGRIFLHRDHHFALVSWAKAVKELGMRKGSVLLHADRHPDLEGFFEQDGVASADLLFEKARTIVKEMDRYPDLLPEERFIKPAIGLGIIGKFIMIPPLPLLTKGAYELDLPIPRETLPLHKIFQEHRPDPGRDYILDLDLDFFIKEQNIKDDIKNITKLIQTFKPKIITIAFSPASSMMRERYLEIDRKACCRVIGEIMIASGIKSDCSIEIIPEDRRVMRDSPK